MFVTFFFLTLLFQVEKSLKSGGIAAAVAVATGQWTLVETIKVKMCAVLFCVSGSSSFTSKGEKHEHNIFASERTADGFK